MRIIGTILIFSFFFISSTFSTANNRYMIDNPSSYIKIHDYTVYATWSSVAILHNVVIENTSDVTYENIKIRICYSSLSQPGNIVSQEKGVLAVTLPPKSKANYLREGITFGGAAQAMNAVAIQVLDAEVVNLIKRVYDKH